MLLRSNFHWTLALAVAATMTCVGLNQFVFAEADPPAPAFGADPEQGPEILTRGPVHEAFAETVNFDPEPGIVVPNAPPELIEELPPDQRPDGDNVDWIPGYWAWDDERNDFLWISGIWRDLPPGRQWVSGYWTEAGDGAQWISGYWADADVEETEYLPEPPQSVEVGPPIEAPSPDQTWLPGTWIWMQDRYVWRPGYWTVVQPNWVWVPDHFVWTPMGYVFVNGYWDYVPADRGIVFAPVYVEPAMYRRRGFTYSPSFALDLDLFTAHLFVRPRYSHYYFGDYYAVSYVDSGFYPWHSAHDHHFYDPFYAHRRWEHRNDRNWAVQIEVDFKRRRDHKEDRPPHNLIAQRDMQKRGNGNRKDFAVAMRLDDIGKRKDGHIKLVSLDKQQREKVREQGKDLRKLRQERKQLEKKVVDLSRDKDKDNNKGPNKKGPDNKNSNNKDSDNNNKDANKDTKNRPARVKLPKSTIVGKRLDQVGKAKDLPKKIQTPKVDPKVEPKVRKNVDKQIKKLNDGNNNNDATKNKNKVMTKPKTDLPKVDPNKVNKNLNKNNGAMKVKPKVDPKAKVKTLPKDRKKIKPKPDPDKDKDKDKDKVEQPKN